MALGPHFSHTRAPPAWPTLSLAVGPKASCTPLCIFGTGVSAWLPSVFHLLLLLAAPGSGASHFCPFLGSSVLDKDSRIRPCTYPWR